MKLPDKRALILLAFSPLACCCCCIPFSFPSPDYKPVNTVQPNVKGANTASDKPISSPVAPIAPVCEKDKEISRTCSACGKATATLNNVNCTTYTKELDDATCLALCPPPPAPPPAPVYVAPKPAPAPQSAPTPPPSSGYVCNCSKTCPQMSSCQEAQYQLNVCGCSARDADHDGIACDSKPLYCQ